MDRSKKHRLSDPEEMKPLGNRNQLDQTLSTSPTAETREGRMSKRTLIIGVAAVLVALVIILGIVLALLLPGAGESPTVVEYEEDPEPLVGTKVNCAGDGYESLKFTSKLKREIYLKYKFIPQRKTFKDVWVECQQDNAFMWQILQGEPEWDAMLAIAKAANTPDMWIAANVDGDCEDGFMCKKDTAVFGKGISVRYPPNEVASYSRLYRAPSEKQNCVFVEDREPYLWTTDSCSFLKTGVCVKRNCTAE